MKKIAIYGKGGIGKSIISSNLSAILSSMGYNVLQFGCDPKGDSTNTLRGGNFIISVLDLLRDNHKADIYQAIHKGFNGVYCVEAGGPMPGVGCAGRGIITAIEHFKSKKVFEELNIDYVIFDVLGDVVCGGFAMPIREQVADIVYTISSSDFMSIYAANNLMKGIKRYSSTNGALFGGIIANSINLEYQQDIITEYANMCNVNIVKYIPRSINITKAELQGCTIIEKYPNSEECQIFKDLAMQILNCEYGIIPQPIDTTDLYKLSKKWGQLLSNAYDRLQ